MSARSHTPPHPATTGGVQTRLPWWALALPALAFVTLFVLILNPTDAQAGTGEPAITQLFQHLQALVGR
ncbi:hypothetical protein AB0E88_31205 [Streptomyces sp. NPDC028635]|uniref:hypothetical protein n=1 Tax=Streptomyces sp. NPDC028635 TaxID=3154800 RepID=UPI00340C895B